MLHPAIREPVGRVVSILRQADVDPLFDDRASIGSFSLFLSCKVFSFIWLHKSPSLTLPIKVCHSSTEDVNQWVMKNMTVERIIEMCGGESEIAYRMRLANKDVVRRWKRRGIPLANWETLVEMASGNGHELSADMLFEAVRGLTKKRGPK
ncbi:hypothetical protein EP7_004304 [Isosphaeraceae bacterium EP7]